MFHYHVRQLLQVFRSAKNILQGEGEYLMDVKGKNSLELKILRFLKARQTFRQRLSCDEKGGSLERT